MRQPRRRPLIALASAVLLTGLTACGSGGTGNAPAWVPKQDAPYQAEPGVPGQAPSDNPSAGPFSANPRQSPSPGQSPATDPNVLARNLTAPIGLSFLPDGSALVGERTTGRILHVQASADQPTPTVQTLAGLDTSGDGGLLDLAVSPNYAEDKLVYALITTPADLQVVTFSLGGPVTPVVTSLPKGPARMQFDGEGQLLVAAGATLNRYDDIGRPSTDNPTAGSAALTTGLTSTAGLCLVSALPTDRTGASVLIASATGDQIGVAVPGGALSGPIASLPAGRTGISGCAVIGQRVFVSTLAGQAVLAVDLTASGTGVQGGAFSVTLNNTYGRLRTVVAAPDGALWLTTSNKDGQGKPVADDERVVRILPVGGGGNGSKA